VTDDIPESSQMSDTLKKTIGHLPELLSKNASSMMQRMVDFMQNIIAADPQMGPSSYLALMLKMSSDQLVREFDAALRESMTAIRRAAEKSGGPVTGFGMSIEPLEAPDPTAEADFARSTQLYQKLLPMTTLHEIRGFSAYRKEVFLTAVSDAFAKSKIDADATKKLMPLARKALNAELIRLYEKINTL
jgi:hypothetical protein